MGKGLVTLSPYHSDKFLLNPVAAAGLLTVLHISLDLKRSKNKFLNLNCLLICLLICILICSLICF